MNVLDTEKLLLDALERQSEDISRVLNSMKHQQKMLEADIANKLMEQQKMHERLSAEQIQLLRKELKELATLLEAEAKQQQQALKPLDRRMTELERVQDELARLSSMQASTINELSNNVSELAQGLDDVLRL